MKQLLTLLIDLTIKRLEVAASGVAREQVRSLSKTVVRTSHLVVAYLTWKVLFVVSLVVLTFSALRFSLVNWNLPSEPLLTALFICSVFGTLLGGFWSFYYSSFDAWERLALEQEEDKERQADKDQLTPEALSSLVESAVEKVLRQTDYYNSREDRPFDEPSPGIFPEKEVKRWKAS